MEESQIEAMIASPPERDELVVQLFSKLGGQWGEIFREKDIYLIDLYFAGSEPLRLNLDSVIQALSRSKLELMARLESK
jgi:hypothetical protein